jgi:hypothetical protein
MERLKAQAETDRRRQDALRTACADFTAALVRIRHLAWLLRSHPTRSGLRALLAPRQQDKVLERLEAAHEDARVGFERLRLLSGSLATQEAGRCALRHAYAVRKQAETGVDPRAHEYRSKSPGDPPPPSPGERFNRELQNLYVAVRTELDVPTPEDVFPEPTDWVARTAGGAGDGAELLLGAASDDTP